MYNIIKKEHAPITEIKFSDSEEYNHVTILEESDSEGVCIIRTDCEEDSLYIRFEDIDYLIEALQMAKKEWME